MTASELRKLLASTSPPILIEVLPPEIFAARRIPGSRSACVYEVSFPDQVAAIAKKDDQLVVYGAGSGSRDAEVAVEKLAALGYANVEAFTGGLDAWTDAGLPLENDAELPATPAPEGTYRVDARESVIRWTGRNLFNHHSGTVSLADGEIVVHGGELISARFTVVMDSVACEDITDPAMNRLLIDHLRSDDFFDVVHHPEATFMARSAMPLPESTEGSPTHLLRGDFTLRGITRTLAFPIQVASLDGIRLTAQGTLDLDRTEFGSIYGSGKFFRFLGKHLVNDIIHLHLKLHADLAH